MDLRALADAMGAIAYLADDTKDSINVEAETVGCNFKHER